MPDDITPVPGSELAALRNAAGLGQEEVARRLGMHRTRLSVLENSAEVDVLRAARYRAAIRTLVDEALAAITTTGVPQP